MFTDPELARVGLNEKEARSRGLAYRLCKLPMTANLRARTLSETRGFMKALIAKESDQILGFTIFGVEAGEVISVAQTAMLGEMPYTVMRDAIYTRIWLAALGSFLERSRHRYAALFDSNFIADGLIAINHSLRSTRSCPTLEVRSRGLSIGKRHFRKFSDLGINLLAYSTPWAKGYEWN
jgi:hypothetical protein